LKQTSFLGRVEHDEIYQLYSNSDIFLNASKIDNQPLSILEAFACGLPVVTTDAGGIPDIVRNGETGFVVAIGDSEALAERAVKLLKDNSFAMVISRRALVECQRYTWDVVCDQWLHLYHKLCSKTS
jgi:glycosyltransferase involved in cell wall biosynthesis